MKLVNLFFYCYQFFLSPILHILSGPHFGCRYTPTCSQYAKQAIQIYGLKGIHFVLKRILKCHPFTQAGYDPVPDVKNRPHALFFKKALIWTKKH